MAKIKETIKKVLSKKEEVVEEQLRCPNCNQVIVESSPFAKEDGTKFCSLACLNR